RGGGAGAAVNGPARYPGTRMGVEFVIRDAFTRAKAYQKEWQDYDRRRKAGETVVVPRRDLQLEPLVEILEGKRLVHAHSYRADVVIWNHHPLSSYAIVNRVYIDGQKYYDRQDDQQRLTGLLREKESLVSAERAERDRQQSPTSTDAPAPRADDRPVAAAAPQ